MNAKCRLLCLREMFIRDEDSKDKDEKDNHTNNESKEKQETNDHRNWRDTERLTQYELDMHSNDYTHQTVLDKDLNELDRRESGSIAPDHMAAYDKDGNAIKNNYANASHFENLSSQEKYGIIEER